MSTHKHLEKICLVAVILSLILTFVFMNGESFGIQKVSAGMGYETRLFDTSQVHTIDIVMDDWDEFIENCENEEYVAASVVIDGEAYKNVGIRAKGNTSLSTVSSLDSDRYSFKIEFDQYESAKNYYGLDKLSLNNIIQDYTYMKDYLTYRMMGEFGVDAPLCSYVFITVNGEEWGLYLAVEGVEDGFLQRNYGSDYGDVYKPDSMSFGGGRGNGRAFDMDEFMEEMEEKFASVEGSEAEHMPDAGAAENAFARGERDQGQSGGRRGGFGGGPGGNMGGGPDGGPGGMNGGPGGGMGSDDVKLQYIDDDPDSYSNIFNSAETLVTDADKERLIESLKVLSEGENIEDVVEIDKVIRYFVVHNFVCNGDSYTGSMIHNYYLYEKDGKLSMIPWDYNLAYGTFQSSDATGTVNTPIDTPVSGGTGEDRPMIHWIFNSEEYTELYHQYFAEFLESADFVSIIDETAKLIAPYVEKDPTKFCTYEEFENGVAAIREFCRLRAQSVQGQLDGTIPSTTEGQSADDTALVDASHIVLSDMGSMGGHGGGPGGGPGGPGGGPNPFDRMATDSNAMPGNMPGNPERGRMSGGPRRGRMPGNPGDGSMPTAAGAGSQNAAETAVILGVSILILAAGLAVVFRFKKKS